MKKLPFIIIVIFILAFFLYSVKQKPNAKGITQTMDNNSTRNADVLISGKVSLYSTQELPDPKSHANRCVREFHFELNLETPEGFWENKGINYILLAESDSGFTNDTGFTIVEDNIILNKGWSYGTDNITRKFNNTDFDNQGVILYLYISDSNDNLVAGPYATRFPRLFDLYDGRIVQLTWKKVEFVKEFRKLPEPEHKPFGHYMNLYKDD